MEEKGNVTFDLLSFSQKPIFFQILTFMRKIFSKIHVFLSVKSQHLPILLFFVPELEITDFGCPLSLDFNAKVVKTCLLSLD